MVNVVKWESALRSEVSCFTPTACTFVLFTSLEHLRLPRSQYQILSIWTRGWVNTYALNRPYLLQKQHHTLPAMAASSGTLEINKYKTGNFFKVRASHAVNETFQILIYRRPSSSILLDAGENSCDGLMTSDS
jgi:hypothetical protein